MGGTPVEISHAREIRAEANTIPYLNERFPGGKGHASMPERITKAIQSYQKSHMGN
jgi:hypothetical protein